MPEREQLHRGPDPADFDLEACTAWVWEHLAGPSAKGKAAEVLEDGAREVRADDWGGEARRVVYPEAMNAVRTLRGAARAPGCTRVSSSWVWPSQ